MVSQGAQTNGITLPNGRKLMKSYSEAGGKFNQNLSDYESSDHEPLQRTQSEEPPRSPYMVKTPPESPEPPPISEASSINERSQKSEEESDHENEESLVYENLPKVQKEIIIDYEPHTSPELNKKKKPLLKTASDGEILLDRRRAQRLSIDSELLPDKILTSVSHDNICISDNETRSFTPYFQNSPIRHEDIFKTLSDEFPEHAISFRAQDSLDEELHENLIYEGIFRKPSSSLSEHDIGEDDENEENDEDEEEEEEEEDGVVPILKLKSDKKISPFASTDSLANDIR